jgi:hypothetical protein
MLIAAICCGAPLPPGTRPDWEVPIFFAGLAFGVMLMAVLQRYAKRREKKALGDLGNSIGGAVPERRWNGRYPADEERRRP